MVEDETIGEDEHPSVATALPIVQDYFVDRTKRSQAVEIRTVYEKVYDEGYVPTYKGKVRMMVLKKTISYCRKMMRPFIVPIEAKGKVVYFVPTTKRDFVYYVKVLNKAIVGMKYTMSHKIPQWLSEQHAILADMRVERDARA